MKKILIAFILTALLLVACSPKEEVLWTPAPTSTADDNVLMQDAPGVHKDTEEEIQEPSIVLEEIEKEVEPIETEEPIVEEKEESDIPIKVFDEGDKVEFPNLATKDADGDEIEYTFSEPLDENGVWQTEIGDAGLYKITITASDSKGAQSTQDVLLNIQPVNKAPKISFASQLSVEEGDTVTLNPKVTDADGDEVEIEFSGWMTTEKKKTTYNDAGTYSVTITATDSNGAAAQKEVTIIVENKNRAPKLSGLDDITIKEGDAVSVAPEVEDADGDDIHILFESPLDSSGSWTTEVGDAGEYDIMITADDGTEQVKSTVTIKVLALNQAPDLSVPDEITVQETETVVIAAIASDPDGDDVEIEYSGWMSSSTKTTDYDDAGEYTVTVTATDDQGAETEETITIIVEDLNRPPEILI